VHLEVCGDIVFSVATTLFDTFPCASPQSDYDVCSTCGSLNECVHDREEGMGSETTCATDHAAENLLETEGYYEMVSNAPILPNMEVFNTYGENLSNAQLLARYGFALDGNENDRVTWNLEELWTDYVGLESGRIERITGLWVEVVEKWSDRWGELFSESELVQLNPGRVWTGGRGGNEDNVFWVNADGKITHQMWLYCALLILGDGGEDDGIEETLETLSAAADLQVELEKSTITGDNGWEGPGTGIGPNRDLSKIPTVVTGIGHRVVDICLGKKDQIGKIGCHTGQLGRFADVRVCQGLLLRMFTVACRTFEKTCPGQG
jgi:SET domain-containing protein 6